MSGAPLAVLVAALASAAVESAPAGAPISPAPAAVPVSVSAPASAPTPSSSALPGSGQVPTAEVDRVIRAEELTESSGLAVSPGHPGVLWTHNDSGSAGVLFAVDKAGRIVARVRVTGVSGDDWEAMAAWRDRDGHPMLAVADIGDNTGRRDHVEIGVLPEPARLGEPAADRSAVTRLAVERRLRLRYPTGPADAETFLVDPVSRRMFLVTKGLLAARIFAVPEGEWPGAADGGAGARSPDASSEVTPAELLPVGSVGLSFATDGVVLSSGFVLLRSYGALMLLAPLADRSGALTGPPRVLATVPLPGQRQGEGLTSDGVTVYLTSEGSPTPVLAFALPAALRDQLAAADGASDQNEPSASGSLRGASPGARPSLGGDRFTTPWGLGVGALLACGLLGGSALAWLTLAHRSRGRRGGG